MGGGGLFAFIRAENTSWSDRLYGPRPNPIKLLILNLTLTLTLTPNRTQNGPETGEKRGCAAFGNLFIIPI